MKFTRHSRLTSQAEFGFVFAQPEVTRDRYFRVLCRPNEREQWRLGMAISRKTCRSAVSRNRIKRIVRESFRNRRTDEPGKSGFDIVVLPNGIAATICNETLRASLAGHWKNIETGVTTRTGKRN